MDRSVATPFFVIDEEKLQKDLTMLQTSLAENWPNYTIGYSFKTNSLPWLVSYLKEHGVIAEVVSSDEFSLARYLGFTDREIIYNGPCKSRDSFRDVLLAGGYVNLDAVQELEWLEEVSEEAPEQSFGVGIRVNFDLEHMCPGQTTMGERSGRFGFCYETGVFASVVGRVRRLPNVKITGLHLHSSSKTRSVAVFEAIAQMTCRLKREFDLTLSYVDLGGGYCGGMPGRPQYPDYFPPVAAILREEFAPEETELIVEPGISLLSSATTFVTSVIDVRDVKGSRYLITDGSRFNIDTTMIKSSYFFHREDNPDYTGVRAVLPNQCVSGYTCMEVDRLFEYENAPELVRGDRIVYENVGGYTMSLTPLFIQYFPAVYVRRNGKLLLVRKRWTPKEYVQNSFLYNEECENE